MVGAHQHGPNSQQECLVCGVLDTHEHAFMHCPMAAYVWPALLEWTKHVWEAEKLTPPTPSVALCMLGLMPSGEHKYPPKWWQLMQRIALRWIWVTHAQRPYGDDMMYGGPESLLSHIQQEFASRLEWDWNKIMQRHAKTHSATTRRKPSQVLQHRWGKVASCNKEGNEVSIMLANNWPG